MFKACRWTSDGGKESDTAFLANDWTKSRRVCGLQHLAKVSSAPVNTLVLISSSVRASVKILGTITFNFSSSLTFRWQAWLTGYVIRTSIFYLLGKSHLSKGSNGRKQKCTQFPTPFLATVFRALSHDVIHFVLSVSFENLEMEVSDWLLKNFNE